jgi:2-hydroxy-3-keto-5-methylthiopentenyl-1-phosphate phosphatase
MTVVVNGDGTITGLTSASYMPDSLGSGQQLRLNNQTISENITLPADKNAMSAGPITVADGYTVTVLGNWTVV